MMRIQRNFSDKGDPVRHAQMAIKAKRLIRESLMRDDNCSQTKAIEIAAWELMEDTPGVYVAAFVEGAFDAGMNTSTARTCWYRARKEMREWHGGKTR